LGSALLFRALQRALGRLPLPAHVRGDRTRTWRWRNLLVSFAHSVLSGPWAVLAVLQAPEMLTDIERPWSASGHVLVCFSAAYFIHDSLDIVLSRQARASWEYLVHHAMAISAFLSGTFQRRFLGAGLLSLFVEVSNIFLTIRMLLKLSNVPAPVLYRVNKYVNLVMYFLFRLAPQAYLSWCFLRHVEQRGLGAFLTVNLCLLNVMILTYFSRLLRSDFFPHWRKCPGAGGEKKFLTE
ncbi:PREDICTED: calfacilitin, partial [Crocodylus porosus]|uniref:calfacilitin n=1 Tax=Crocodylus porosus TaxID=8502 RepID=UPI00093DAB34